MCFALVHCITSFIYKWNFYIVQWKTFIFCFLHQIIKHILPSCPLSLWPNAQNIPQKTIILVPFRVDWCRTPYCLPFDRSLPIDFNTLSRKKTQKHINALVLADISGRWPCVWSVVFIIGSWLHNSTSVRQQKHFSHLLDCTVHLGDHHHYRWPSSHLLTVSIIDR